MSVSMNNFDAILADSFRQWATVDRRKVGFVAPYANAHSDVIRVPDANIATDLGPQLENLLQNGSHLSIVGYDGATVADPKYVWKPTLERWLQRGCTIDYLLLAPSATAIAAFKKVSQGLTNGQRLRLFRRKQVRQQNIPNVELVLDEWETFHFVVSESPETLWIETNHPTSDPKAHNCYFFPPKAALETGLAKDYKRRFDQVIAAACDEVPLS